MWFFLLFVLPCLANPVTNARGRAYLDSRQYRMAAQVFRESLLESPGKPSLELGLGRSLAGMGRCEEALPLLERNRESLAYGWRAAMALASCHEMKGAPQQALYFLDEASRMRPEGSGIELQAALIALESGNEAAFLDALHDFEDEQPFSSSASVSRARYAYYLGDYDALWLELLTFDSDGTLSPSLGLLQGRTWLDLDDPHSAIEVLTQLARQAPGLPSVAFWLGEAHRRAGNPHHALAVLEAPRRKVMEDVVRDAIVLRVHADLEGVDSVWPEALELLEHHPTNAEIVATAWYLSLKLTEPSMTDELARRHASLLPPGRSTLSTLHPSLSRSP